MSAKPAVIFEYIVDLGRPFGRRRLWRMGVPAARRQGGDEYVAAVYAEGQRELKRKAEAAWQRAGATGTLVLALLEEPLLVSQGWGKGYVASRADVVTVSPAEAAVYSVRAAAGTSASRRYERMSWADPGPCPMVFEGHASMPWVHVEPGRVTCGV